jgi:uncharacterized protein HemX
MSKQHTRRRRACCAVVRALAVGGAAAALVAILGTGQALASTAQPDERILERQGRIDRQADEQGKAEESSRQAPPPRFPRRFTKPEPDVSPGPWIDEQTAPTPAPARGRPDVAVPATVAVLGLAVAVLALAVGVAAWWVRHRRPPPEPTT